MPIQDFGDSLTAHLLTIPGGLTPANIYSSSNKYFEYNVQIYYGDLPLRDPNGSPICIKAYIGLNGDISLDNKLDSTDASDILRFYSYPQTGGSFSSYILTSNPIVTNSQDPLNELARYLADVNGDGFIDASDASYILRTYSQNIGK
ncbi:MAG: cellulose-binding protein CttA-related protein [Ruminococcus sp.]|nr:cellulose-binding protein CttA-related protein [Ruminococcus sp.]